MRKLILILLVLCTSFTRVNAITLNNDETYTTAKGVTISKEDYELLITKFPWRIIDRFNEETITSLLNGTAKIDNKEIYTITTDTIDKNGNIINSVTIPATESEALSVISNPNIRVIENGELYDFSNECASTYTIHQNEHATSSKKVSLSYISPENSDYYEIVITAEWLKEPTIKQYDVLAVRWNNSLPLSNVKEYIAFQEAYNSSKEEIGYQEYELDGENMKRTTYGIGQSMNLFNNGKLYKLAMHIEIEEPVNGNVYGTYQHARHSNANTLAISQSYTFSNNGLGNVLYYSNSTYRGYYDNMDGVKAYLGDNYSINLWG